MEQTPRSVATDAAGNESVPSASAAEPGPAPEPAPASKEGDGEAHTEAAAPATKDDAWERPPDNPPLSKNQLKKRRRLEKSQAVKKRRKEQSREVRRLKAEKEGRDLDAERREQLKRQQEGQGWAKREERWQEIVTKADIKNSFRVCFDCSFEKVMTWKETNSLGLQLRYAYAVNRKSTKPVYIDVCGMTKGSQTRGHLEKVQGFPDKWVGRAYQCYEGLLEEVYEKSVNDTNDGVGTAAVDDDDKNCEGEVKKDDEKSCEGEAKKNVENCEEDVKTDDDKTCEVEADKDDNKNCDGKGKKDATSNTDSASNTESGETEPSHPSLPPDHQFVYLTGDSPNTLTTLDNNTTYIIGGIVDRNRLKRAAVDRADTIAEHTPALNIRTARLPLDEHVNFKSATRILTCNHVFEILLQYREQGYEDWKGAIMTVLPFRKDLEERQGAEASKESKR